MIKSLTILSSILKNMPNTQISVRVNLDKDNVGDFKRIREELLEKWKSYDNITIYPGILRIEDPVNKCMGCQSLLHDDVRELFYGLRRKHQLLSCFTRQGMLSNPFKFFFNRCLQVNYINVGMNLETKRKL